MAVRAQNIQLPKMRHPLVRADGHGTELADCEDAVAEKQNRFALSRQPFGAREVVARYR